MTLRPLVTSLGIVLAIGLAGQARAQEKGEAAQPPGEGESSPASTKGAARKSKTELATFGGGCFWSMEAVFERIPGVKAVTSGFAGGTVPNPSYEMVGTGQTGHAEVVQIEFDPKVVSYEKLLNVFWHAHDPTTLNCQGDDFGTQYRSMILFHTEDQKQAALRSYRDLTSRRTFRSPIVTELLPSTGFFPAELYHQDYFRNHPDSVYSQIYIIPKLKKLKLVGRSPARRR